MVCKIYEGIKVKYGYHKQTGFGDIDIDNIRASNKLGSRMGIRGKIRQVKIAKIVAAVLIGFCGGLRGE